jgi:hypothetical protein
MKTVRLAAAFLALSASAQAQDSVQVTVDNFPRAESDLYFGSTIKDAGGVGKFFHNRTPTDVAHQPVIRMNRDTLYSGAVFDLDAGPVKLTFPDTGDRFMSLQVIDEDHYVHGVFYGAGKHELTKDQIGTRYVMAAVRTLVNPNDPKDVEEVHALQDAIKTEQAASGVFEVPKWDQESQKKVRDALLVLGATRSGFRHAFGSNEEVDPIYHLIGTAMGWGGNPDKDATYLSIVPPANDGKTIQKLHIPGDVPVDAFWSISLYNAQGFFEPNQFNAYSLNNITAEKQSDGSVDVQFGGCDGKIPNCLPIMEGWNYTVRLYRPRAEILDGKWKFPDPEPVK